jgi:hypothetical protein
MATQSVIHPIEQSKLAIVPFPAPKPITQIEFGCSIRVHPQFNLAPLEETCRLFSRS